LNIEDLKYYIKLKQKKYREENRQFLIEGIHLIEECLKSKYYKKNIIKTFVRNDFDNENILKKLRNTEIEYLKTAEFNKLSETDNSQGIIAAVYIPENLPFNTGKIICAIDNLNDPGNLGTILRTCWWFGIENVLIGMDSVDLFNSKVIRASQGAIFNLFIRNKINLYTELNNLYEKGNEIILTDINAKNISGSYKFHKDKKYIIVFGNEANGISKDIKSVPHFNKIKIESYSNCESLNVASSAAIIFYEIKKNK
jgi:RNA methyltransferase, TrmH family